MLKCNQVCDGEVCGGIKGLCRGVKWLRRAINDDESALKSNGEELKCDE